MSPHPPEAKLLPEAFAWLADAPLFIDSEQVDRFYDAVARPNAREGATKVETRGAVAWKWGGKLSGEVKVTSGPLLTVLAPVFPFLLGAEAKGGLTGEGAREQSRQDANITEFHAIDNPQRQLVQLAIHYLVNLFDRLFTPEDTVEPSWCSPEQIAQLPRALVFLDLPGQAEAERDDRPETKLIPTAAEFANGKIVPLYPSLKKETGEDRPGKKLAVANPPKYPERAKTLDLLLAERRKYWGWFEENFSATQGMGVIEEAASENGRIRWIDYRLPLTRDGDTLHLHLSPAGCYDTGVLAYNLVKRGYKHGLRLIGTLKSEPDLNVLAIYEK